MSLLNVETNHAQVLHCVALLAACAFPQLANRDDPQQRFKGVGIILVIDAVTDAEMRGVMFYDDRGQAFYASSLVARRNREILSDAAPPFRHVVPF